MRERLRKSSQLKWIKLTLALAISSTVVGLRQLGILQYWEWQGIDLMFQLRPAEKVDRRIIIVGFTNDDMRSLGDSRLSDAQIAQLIKVIKQGKPRAIGLDIFRDHPIGSGHQALMTLFQTTPNLYGIGKQTGIKGDPDYDLIDPPPIPQAQIADVSAALDGDDVQRRAFLYPVTQKQQIPSLGLFLAYEYLYAEGISPQKSTRGGLLDLRKATFYRFRNQTGPYVRTNDKSYQILMNWRKASFKVVSVTEVLSEKVSPQIFQERLVIIGGFAPKLGDQFLTPFNRGIGASPRKMYGSEAQAQLSSMVISAAIDERPLVKVWYEPWISLGIFGWGGVTFLVLNYFNRQWLKILIFLVGSSGLLGTISYLAFLDAIWLPLIPALLVLWTVGIILSGLDYEWGRRVDLIKIRQLNHELKKLTEKLEKKIEYRQIYKDNMLQYQHVSQQIYPDLENIAIPFEM